MKRIIIIMSLLLIASVAMATPILQQLPIKVHGDTLFWNIAAPATPPYQWQDTLVGINGMIKLDSLTISTLSLESLYVHDTLVLWSSNDSIISYFQRMISSVANIKKISTIQGGNNDTCYAVYDSTTGNAWRLYWTNEGDFFTSGVMYLREIQSNLSALIQQGIVAGSPSVMDSLGVVTNSPRGTRTNIEHYGYNAGGAYRYGCDIVTPLDSSKLGFCQVGYADDGVTSQLYFGGWGFSVPNIMEQYFWTNSFHSSLSTDENAGMLAMKIDKNSNIIMYNGMNIDSLTQILALTGVHKLNVRGGAAIDTIFSNNILPYITNAGQIGTATNAWNSFTGDTTITGRLISLSGGKINMGDTLAWDAISKIFPGGNSRWIGTTIYVHSIGNPTSDAGINITGIYNKSSSFSSNGRLNIYTSTDSLISIYSTSNTTKNLVALACSSNSDTTNNGWLVTKNAIRGKKTGSFMAADTLSGYNGNIWAVNSWGITITGVDTLAKFYMSSFDSTKFVRVWGNIKSASSGGDPDTLCFKDSLRTDSIKVTIAVGSNWLAPAIINKKWPTNPAGVVNPVYCIFRKGATTAAANMQFFHAYLCSKGRTP